MHAIRIDRSKPLCDEPNCGHNRYHPDIAPAAEIGEGEEIALETRDALDGQITPATTIADFASLDAGKVHPLTARCSSRARSPAISSRSSSPTSSRSPPRSARSCRVSAFCAT